MPVRVRIASDKPALFFVTTTVKDWINVFSSPEFAHIALSTLSESAEHFQFSVVGYVLMPSHLHALLGLHRADQLSRVMQSYKILTSKRVRSPIESSPAEHLQIPCPADVHICRLFTGDRFQLWKPRFDDLVVHTEKQFRIKLDYIHNNPVKAGLVTTAIDWPYSSAKDWLLDVNGAIPIDKNCQWLAD